MGETSLAIHLCGARGDLVNRKTVVFIATLGLMSFNMVMIFISLQTSHSPGWWAPELGPSIMQDSYFDRSPGIGTPFGVIGDVPGGYSMYHGNPYNSYFEVHDEEFAISMSVNFGNIQAGISAFVLIALLFVAIPWLLFWILGGRSYGASKAC